MPRLVQRSICCPCGNDKVLALGLCATCYTLKRQDEEYFGGHREAVLTRDGNRCAVPGCTTLKRGKRSIAVHHRKPGNSDPKADDQSLSCLSCQGDADSIPPKRMAPSASDAMARATSGKLMNRLPLISRKRERLRGAAFSSEMNMNPAEVRDIMGEGWAWCVRYTYLPIIGHKSFAMNYLGTSLAFWLRGLHRGPTG